MDRGRKPADDRIRARADDAPAEEEAAGSDDPTGQAAAILADSDRRQDSREGWAGTVEHRIVSGDGPARERWIPGMGTDGPVDERNAVRVVGAGQLDSRTAQTPGMSRQAAISAATGASALWAGTVSIQPGARTGAHHHGDLESIIYVLRGRARMRWGGALQYAAEAGPGDFIFVAPWIAHQEINAAADQPLECVLVRSGQEAVVVNLDIDAADEAAVTWVDPNHP